MQESHVQPGPPFRVLIVDDSPEDRELYRRILSRNNTSFEISEAESIAQGLQKTQEMPVDCIVVDYKLPDGDGIDFIHAYQELQKNKHAAIVMVTANGSEKVAVEAMKLGALDYITKSRILEGFFTQSVLNAIERQHMKDEILRYQDELERSYQALSEFTHTASHDLKAPLRHIASYCALLEEDFSDKLGPDGAAHVKRLQVNAARLQTLVDDLLSYSEAINAKEERAPVDCKAVVAEVVEMLEESLSECGGSVRVEALPTVMAYPLRMKQIFQNLISNALKYKSSARAPVITVSGEDRGQDVIFSVADNGSGIEKEHSDVIFQAFKRLHSRDEIEGSGLGLSICRKIADMHGGRIWVESELGKGSTFFFTIRKPDVYLTGNAIRRAG